MNHRLREWVQKYPVVNFAPKSSLIEAGRDPEELFAITEGLVKMVYTSEEGNQIITAFFSPGSIIPLPQTLLKIPNDFSFHAICSVQTHAIPVKDIKTKLKNDSEFSNYFLHSFLRGFNFLVEQIIALKQNRAEDKIKVVIKQLTGKSCGDDSESFIENLTQQEIAELAGVSRETVSRSLAKILKNL